MEGVTLDQAAESSEAIKTSLNYLAEATPKPVTYVDEPPAGVAQRSGHYLPYSVSIHNGRAIANELSLDRQGFMLVRHETAVRDFYDRDEVRTVYYPEVERLLKRVTGAERVVIFDQVVRNPFLAQRAEKGARKPVEYVHNDYSLRSAAGRVRAHLGDEAEALLRHRFAEVNVWRPIRGPLQNQPLALCDARSISLSDAVASDLVYADRVGETFAFTFNPNHRWFYFPNMRRDEAVLLKCFDSKDDGRARFTAHTAFAHPATPPDAAPRESIEIRALLFFPAEED